MKKKTKITLVAATLIVLSLTIIAPRTLPQEPPQQPDVRPVSALAEDSRGNTLPTEVKETVAEQPSQLDAKNEVFSEPISVEIPLPEPTEKEETTNASTPTTKTATKPTAPPASISAEPKMGDTRIIDGKKQSYFLGFGWVDDMGENEVIYCQGMYENGNKVGIMDWINFCKAVTK